MDKESEKKEEVKKEEKKEEKKEVFEFDPKKLKDEDNKFLSKDAKEKNKKDDDDLLGRFANFTGEEMF